jgi:hypothetical protein
MTAVGATLVVARLRINGAIIAIKRREQGDHKGRPYIIPPLLRV